MCGVSELAKKKTITTAHGPQRARVSLALKRCCARIHARTSNTAQAPLLGRLGRRRLRLRRRHKDLRDLRPVGRAHLRRRAARLEASVAANVVEISGRLAGGDVRVLDNLLHCRVVRHLDRVRLRLWPQEPRRPPRPPPPPRWPPTVRSPQTGPRGRFCRARARRPNPPHPSASPTAAPACTSSCQTITGSRRM